MLRERVLVLGVVLGAASCGPVTPTGDGGADAGPETCVAFPESITADYTVEKGCWLVLKTPYLAPAITLTVRPGAKLVFSAGTKLDIAAAQVMQALGTAQDPILFTGSLPVRGHWKGLTISGTTVASHLDYVTIEYAGDTHDDRYAAGVKLIADSRGARVGFSHTTFRENEGYGLYVNDFAELPEFTGNVFTHNGLGPISLSAENVGDLDATSTFTGNDTDEVFVRTYSLNTEATWVDVGVPYRLEDNLSVTARLSIGAGARFLMASQGLITMSGDASAMIAEGTADKPIVFTSSTLARGAWKGLVFNGSNNALNLLRYVTVEYAGDTASDSKAAAVAATSDSHGVQLSLEHVTIRQSEGYGLRLGGSARTLTFTGNTFTQNALGAALVDTEAVHQLSTDSTYAGNELDRVVVEGRYVSGAVTWRALDVPYRFVATLIEPKLVLTLEPGLTLEMGAQTRIVMSGSDQVALNAVGTTERPITITGVTKTPGSWDGINFGSTLHTANLLDHCIVEYGGGGTRMGWKGMIISQSDSHGVRVSVTNSTVRHSATWGIYFNAGQVGAVTGNTYSGNAQGDYQHDP